MSYRIAKQRSWLVLYIPCMFYFIEFIFTYYCLIFLCILCLATCSRLLIVFACMRCSNISVIDTLQVAFFSCYLANAHLYVKQKSNVQLAAIIVVLCPITHCLLFSLQKS